jgi:hypothetical protein
MQLTTFLAFLPFSVAIPIMGTDMSTSNMGMANDMDASDIASLKHGNVMAPRMMTANGNDATTNADMTGMATAMKIGMQAGKDMDVDPNMDTTDGQGMIQKREVMMGGQDTVQDMDMPAKKGMVQNTEMGGDMGMQENMMTGIGTNI